MLLTGEYNKLSTPHCCCYRSTLHTLLPLLLLIIIIALMKDVGKRVSDESSREGGKYITPLLAAFITRCLTLQDESHWRLDRYNTTMEQELIHQTIHRCRQIDDPLLETIKMQVSFEAFYATEIQRMRTKAIKIDNENRVQLEKIVEIGTNIQSNAQGNVVWENIYMCAATLANVYIYTCAIYNFC